MTFESLARNEYFYSDSHVTFVQPSRVYYGEFRRVKGIDIGTAVSELIEQWHKDVSVLSSIDEIKKLASYAELTSYGLPALEYIVRDLEKRPSMLMLAASDIAGESPITDAIRGDVKAMAGAWVGWYQRAKQELL
jgi:hypothetical protein